MAGAYFGTTVHLLVLVQSESLVSYCVAPPSGADKADPRYPRFRRESGGSICRPPVQLPPMRGGRCIGKFHSIRARTGAHVNIYHDSNHTSIEGHIYTSGLRCRSQKIYITLWCCTVLVSGAVNSGP
ncbi:hypothetical protein BGW80DRAFT_76234 [Lactifluus volemus]|nr:hypothetical protein BGW80DRAFT_76234 [Lactifluus volemus]